MLPVVLVHIISIWIFFKVQEKVISSTTTEPILRLFVLINCIFHAESKYGDENKNLICLSQKNCNVTCTQHCSRKLNWNDNIGTAPLTKKKACFVLYLKIINTFLKNNICTLQ